MPLLPFPARHTPWLKGKYDVAPNLRPLGDAKAFEFDTLWPRIRANKEARRPGRVLRNSLSDDLAATVVTNLAHRLQAEWPELFSLGDTLRCRLTGDRIPLSSHGLDDLAMNLPGDLAIVQREAEGDRNAYLHVSAPSHWRPEEKIGRSFVETHAPVPHFDRVSLATPKLLKAMVARGPWVRFVWGFETDMELDHHPDRVRERSFARAPFVVRIERQVLLPLPAHDASIFLIGTGFFTREAILADERLWRPLLRALDGISPEARRYKGIAEGYDDLRAQFPPEVR